MPDLPYVIELQTDAPERREMNDLLTEYYTLIRERMLGEGVDVGEEADTALEEFWNEIDLVLPPKGRLYLARDTDGSLIGCGTLKQIGEGKGELKRLYVKPSFRGTGLGKALVEARIEAAREMGLNEIFVDTIRANIEMRGLYAKLGFTEIDFYSESSTHKLVPPELTQFLLFFRMEL